MPGTWTDGLLAGLSAAVSCCLLAFLNHIYGVRKRTKKGLHAVDHIHYAPGLKQIYGLAERRKFDPYEIAARLFIVKPLTRAKLIVGRRQGHRLDLQRLLCHGF